MKSKYVFFLGLGLFVLGLIIGIVGPEEFGITVATIGGMIMLPGFLISLIIEMCICHQELEEKRKAKLKKIKAEQAENRVRQEELQKERKQKENERQKKNQIVEVKYLGSGATTQKRGGLGGAVVGGMVAGPLGAVVGASIPKNAEGLQRFAVKYGNGRIEIKEVHPNSWEYKELMKYVKWDEIG